jgi:hypothetical protein
MQNGFRKAAFRKRPAVCPSVSNTIGGFEPQTEERDIQLRNLNSMRLVSNDIATALEVRLDPQ